MSNEQPKIKIVSKIQLISALTKTNKGGVSWALTHHPCRALVFSY